MTSLLLKMKKKIHNITAYIFFHKNFLLNRLLNNIKGHLLKKNFYKCFTSLTETILVQAIAAQSKLRVNHQIHIVDSVQDSYYSAGLVS